MTLFALDCISRSRGTVDFLAHRGVFHYERRRLAVFAGQQTFRCFVVRLIITIIMMIIPFIIIALLSALEQKHCARMWFYMSEELFIARFFFFFFFKYPPRWCTYSAGMAGAT